MLLTREEYARRTDKLVDDAERATEALQQQNDALQAQLEQLQREHP